jgi:hypothetical protein
MRLVHRIRDRRRSPQSAIVPRLTQRQFTTLFLGGVFVVANGFAFWITSLSHDMIAGVQRAHAADLAAIQERTPFVETHPRGSGRVYTFERPGYSREDARTLCRFHRVRVAEPTRVICSVDSN